MNPEADKVEIRMSGKSGDRMDADCSGCPLNDVVHSGTVGARRRRGARNLATSVRPTPNVNEDEVARLVGQEIPGDGEQNNDRDRSVDPPQGCADHLVALGLIPTVLFW